MPMYKMTTKRINYQQQQQHHNHPQQRRPPDVEEALSSMLWTPYERSSITDTSSDDEDEQLNCQLKKSKSHYDYTSVPTTMPPLTPPPPPTNATTTLLPLLPPIAPISQHNQPTNIVAYIATPVRAATSSAYYTTEDLCDPSVTTPLVPFSNLMPNANTTTTTSTIMPVPIEATAATAGDDNDDDDGDDDYIYNDVFNNENTLAATSSSTISSSSQHHHHYPHKTRTSYGRIPGLTKWWSTSNATTTTQQQSSDSSSEQLPPLAELSTTVSTTTITTTDDAKQPPSYESLYKKPLRPLRQLNHHQQHSINKHLNIFKPVLETLKANVTTITQGRFTAAITRQDNNRVTNTRTLTQTQAHTPMPMTTITTTTTTTPASNNVCNSESSSSNLVHSFTDNFLHEQCSALQHIEATNVDNEHIINNNNNNNNINSCITTIAENIQSVNLVQQFYDSEEDEEGSVIHQQQQHYSHVQNHIEMNKTQSKQNQENENKQNNNFIICQQQQRQPPSITIQQEQNEIGEFYDKKSENKMNTITIEMNGFSRALGESETAINCDDNDLLTTTAGDTSLFYDSSSAISLARSFEANTSYTVGLTVASDYCKSGLLQETRNCTYNLTPNKCLAELERLYAEFRASESLREQALRETNKQSEKTTGYSDNKTENMRLSVPAATSTDSSSSSSNTNEPVLTLTSENGVGKSVSETKLNPSTSSVFLTTTNSVTTLTNPCQRTPSLTIQVNQNLNSNNNNNNNTNGSDGGSVANQLNNESQHQVILNQAIVNTTTNGVSVINCNYVNNNNNNISSNNNNNKSITNLCDIATNTNQLMQKNNSNINLKNIPKNIYQSDSDNLNNINHHSVPKVLNNNDKINENDKIQKVLKPQRNSHNNTQVNVIQVNEGRNTSISSTPSSPQRTFTSTECQTDDISSVQLISPSTSRPLPPTPTATASINNNNNNTSNNRDQRRRERRERRHLHHTASLIVAPNHSHPHPLRHGHLERHSMPAPPLPPILHPPHLHPGLAGGLQQSAHNVAMLRPMLPDILHNHYPPPYSALPSMANASGNLPNHNGSPIPYNHPHSHHHHHPPPPPPPATILGPPPPPAGTTLLTSVISTVPIPGATPMVSDGRFTLPLPIIRRSPSERSGKGCCGQWFAGPPLRALIAVVALGGVACALGGAALGATGLAGPPSSHFTAALLMIGVGVVLVTVSGAAWRMTAPGGPPCLGLGSSVDLGRCGRRPCSRGGGAPQGLLYPEFQHRPPPPSYQASMQEYRLRLLLLDRDRQNGVVRGSSPPPTYRSHAGSLLRAPLTTTIRGAGGISGGRCESSIGGSEYSFPPSYRSRNTTPGTISSERSIETEPSGRLLANEDIPEPLSVEQLSEYNSLQQRTINSSTNTQKPDQKRNSVQLDTQILLTKADTNLSSDKKDDLVTIVTITPQNNDNLIRGDNNNNNNGQSNQCNVSGNESREQIEILAHL